MAFKKDVLRSLVNFLFSVRRCWGSYLSAYRVELITRGAVGFRLCVIISGFGDYFGADSSASSSCPLPSPST